MVGIIVWIIFGAIVGVVAKLLMPGPDPGGFIMTTLLGIAGALLGGFIGRALGLYYSNQQAGGFLMSILGAVILLWAYRATSRRRTV
ncbi:MAG TPA: GlsB/YeaQ/YmgE family stress response membrane protein [Candidatus Manganitrophaceae bacterium]|nr:GlsB/YeaQ/YmgE family stress response membrane protein [Candidatus Manganitrophaceae bacterium]